jgi:hypothetical protein
MRSGNLRTGQCLAFVLLLAPVLVQPKGLEVQDNKWTKSESKREAGVFDNLVTDKNPKKRSPNVAAAVAAPTGDASVDQSLKLLNDNALDAPATGTTLADESTSGGDSRLMWGILASLCVVGAGLTGFGYYWSHTRRVASW